MQRTPKKKVVKFGISAFLRDNFYQLLLFPNKYLAAASYGTFTNYENALGKTIEVRKMQVLRFYHETNVFCQKCKNSKRPKYFQGLIDKQKLGPILHFKENVYDLSTARNKTKQFMLAGCAIPKI